MIRMELGKNSYDIVVERGVLKRCGELLNLNRKVLILTDSGVPSSYAEIVKGQAKEGYIKVVAQGEGSKSLQTTEEILTQMLAEGFSRKDAVVSVGGGVIGDLGGFVASLYMRGIDFYNVPTTLLSQVDSSIGGKTAVNLAGIKNIIGAFYQPKKVLIDPETLDTLDKRQILSGLMEAVKMGATSSPKLLDLCDSVAWRENIDEIIRQALLVKKYVVEQDEKESHLRKILNFGHTIGHGFESAMNGTLYHGECVALGMLYMSDDALCERLRALYRKVGFVAPDLTGIDMNQVREAITHDKKASADTCSVVYVKAPGDTKIDEWSMKEVLDRLEGDIHEKCIW